MGNKCLKPEPTIEVGRRGSRSNSLAKERTLSSTQNNGGLIASNGTGVTESLESEYGIGAKDQLDIDPYASGKDGHATGVAMPKGAIEEVKDDDSDKGNFLNNLDNEDSISFGDDSGKDND